MEKRSFGRLQKRALPPFSLREFQSDSFKSASVLKTAGLGRRSLISPAGWLGFGMRRFAVFAGVVYFNVKFVLSQNTGKVTERNRFRFRWRIADAGALCLLFYSVSSLCLWDPFSRWESSSSDWGDGSIYGSFGPIESRWSQESTLANVLFWGNFWSEPQMSKTSIGVHRQTQRTHWQTKNQTAREPS